MALTFPNGTFKKSFLFGDGNIELDNTGKAWKSVVKSGGFFTQDSSTFANLKVTLNIARIKL